MMFNDIRRAASIAPPALYDWLNELPGELEESINTQRHGDFSRWQEILRQLPDVEPTDVDFNHGIVAIGSGSDCSAETRNQIEQWLRQLHPWRKGPYSVHGVQIDTEWRSDWKWDRLAADIKPLRGRTVLDVGCGSGYHCWRMLGAGARLVIGIDPTWLSVMQFAAIKHFAGDWPVYVLPLGIERMPAGLQAFDTVFSMGILYHRRSPLDHLLQLRELLRPGGELVLETLVIEGDERQVLLPQDRYAQMRNVWFLPSCDALAIWLKRCGYRNVRLIDVTVTTTDEQRSTDWMRFQSLADFLDPTNPKLTSEGLPAPTRAIFVATAP